MIAATISKKKLVDFSELKIINPSKILGLFSPAYLFSIIIFIETQ